MKVACVSVKNATGIFRVREKREPTFLYVKLGEDKGNCSDVK
jgi:hypothetical protein